MDSKSAIWPEKIYEAFSHHNIRIIANVPDAGHSELIRLCQADKQMQVVTLTTEEEGVGLLCGAWSGGTKGVLLMQSSGVGNCVNALALPIICRIPFLTIVTMRGEWGEFIPWQVPMGKATPTILETMDTHIFRANDPGEVDKSVDAAASLAYNTRRSCAVLLSQKLIGSKHFEEEQ